MQVRAGGNVHENTGCKFERRYTGGTVENINTEGGWEIEM